MLVQISRGYNQKHQRTWDENLFSIQHSYHRVVHGRTNKFLFETCFGYFPPSPLDVVYGKEGGVREETTGEELSMNFLALNSSMLIMSGLVLFL